ncbi:heptaprenylglyceryl phosphate synthase [Symbiobacterium terraclitae]|uniref:heptaprenylglyceryl phosphate synthase n=1 Tax=Symbiobacterium terraclitae TaxID=557451 RepID=UPI0035B502FC
MSASPVTWPPAPDWRAWRHVTKLDPDRPLGRAALDAVYRSGTDAIVLGGSAGMTQAAVLDMLARLADSPVPVALEVSTLESAVPGPALFLIPLVLNAPDSRWLGGAQADALSHILPVVGEYIPWDLLLPEAYLVLNPDCTAARITGADTQITPEGAAAWAALAGRVLRLPLVYVEYSGTFGDMALLQAVREHAGPARVVYGGGIRSAQEAERAARWAHTVVVGNLVYEEPHLLAETVAAVRG